MLLSGKTWISKDNLSMDIEIKAWLYDILNAIIEIDSFFVDTTKAFPTC